MKKCYLLIENSLFYRTAFCLKDALTIGTSIDCDVQLIDENVAPCHARVYLQNQQAVVEDLGSRWGTYLNERHIDGKANLADGDRMRCGGAIIQIVNDLVIQTTTDPEDSGCRPPSESLSLKEIGPALNVQRLEELIPRIPLFANIDAPVASQLVRNSRLSFYEDGQVVFHQGDASKSLFIILDGCVEVTFRDNRNKDTQVAILKDNEFFGEMALLSGEPRNSTVRAVELSYLCEIRPVIMHQLITQYPSVKQTIQNYYNMRMKELTEKKRKASFSENRRHPRYNLTLPVLIKVTPSRFIEHLQGGHAFRLLTKDISISGANIRLKEVNDLRLVKLPLGHPLAVVLILPPPFDVIETQATVARLDLPDSGKRRPFGRMGIKFKGMTKSQGEKLESFLRR